MSWTGRVFILLSIVTFLIMFSARVYLGGWLSILYIPLATSVIALILAIVIDIKFYAELLTMRSTKNGLSLGLSVLLFIVSLVSINFISVKLNQSIDVSSRQVNSISPEVKNILSSVTESILVSTYYRGKKDKVKLMQIKQDLQPYIKKSKWVDVNYVNIYQSAAKAKIELKDIPNENKVITLLRHKDKVIQVNYPVDKDNIERAFTLVTRGENKKIHILTGQGLRSIYDEGYDGILGLTQVLTSKGYRVEGLTQDGLISNNLESHKLILLAGPQINLSRAQISKLVNFVQSGGHLIIAADPDEKQFVQKLSSQFGFHYKNNYIISEVGEKFGRSPTTSVGVLFSSESEISKEFTEDKQAFALFETTSEVRVIKNKYFEKFNYIPMIATSKQSFTVDELKIKLTAGERASKTVSVLASSKSTHSGKVLLIGDSDFLTNKDLLQGINRQLIINTVSSMLGEQDLINKSVDDKLGTKIILTDRLKNSIVVAGSLIPFALLMISSLLFYRRKGA